MMEDFGPPDRPGFWSGETIKQRLFRDQLVLPGDPARVDRASYQLTVGSEIFISPAEASEQKYRARRMLKPGETAEIPPGQFALLITAETVNVPENAMAFISTRSKDTKFRGLINVSGFYVDPGYSGKLIFAMFNAGPASVHVSAGDPWFAILFADLDRRRSTMVRDGKDGFTSIPSRHITPLANEFLTFQGLNKKIRDTEDALEARIEKIERDNGIIRWGAALILTFAIALGVRSCSDRPASPVSDTPLQAIFR